MNELLQLAIERHGGMNRWRRVQRLVAEVRLSGATFHLKQQAGVIGRHRVTVDTRRQSTVVEPMDGPGSVLAYTPESVDVRDAGGETILHRENPRAAFDGHTLTTPWDAGHLAYFTGYTLWNYLTAPFSLTMPDVTSTEIEPLEEDGQTFRRLEVHFPESYATHNPRQIFSFDSEGLLRRRIYAAEVVDPSAENGLWAAHLTDGDKEYGGLIFQTHRRILGLDEALRLVPQPVLITIDIDDIEVFDEPATSSGRAVDDLPASPSDGEPA